MRALTRFVTLFACSAALLAPQTLADDKKPVAEAAKAAGDAAKAALDGTKGAAPAGAPSAADMKAMMEACEKMAALNDNHKLLATMVGDWDYTCKMQMDPSAPAQESKGTAKHVSMMDGRYIHSEHHGMMQMPGEDGKMVDKPFHGAGVTGYDNAKQKFVNVWMDNFSTGFFHTTGMYDAAAKTFTYTGDMDDPMSPGSMVKIRYTIKMTDNDHHTFTWFETRGGQEMQTMQMSYTRKK